MKTRYRLMRRGRRGGGCYCVDTKTGKRTSLGTRDEAAAREIVAARNQAERQPVLNLQIAKAYLAGSDHGITTRTWQQAADALVTTKRGANKERWLRALQDRALVPLLPKVIIETPGDLLLRVLHLGTVSTNVFLRRLHNFCADMNWLPWPLIPKRQWPVLRFKEKRAITRAEHELILSRETNEQMRAFLHCCWHIGGSQSDVANLKAEDIDWRTQVISFFRAKTRAAQIIRFGAELAGVLRGLPASGPLFPRLALLNERHRSSLFQRSCARVGVVGVSLYSYRYAWAERARSCGYPERFAQEALGHNSKAVHRAYARNAQVTVPSLEEYENKRAEKKVIPFPLNRPTAPTSTTPPNQTPATAPPVLAFILPFRSAG